MILPTPFQIRSARFLFALHFIFLTVAVFPNQVLAEKWLWYSLLPLTLLLGLGFVTTWVAIPLSILWIWKLHLPVFQHNPAAFLILYTLFFLGTQQPESPRPFIFRMFWVLFIITVAFDFMSAINTVLDLFPFGMKYEHGNVPPKVWMRFRIFIDGFFLFGLMVRPLRPYGWFVLLLGHSVWMGGMGYSEFSSTLIFTLPFLFNPDWTTSPSDNRLKPFLFYDGICVLCTRFTKFLFAEDFAHHFYYAPLQGKTAKEKLPRADQNQVHSIILFDESKCYYRLDAVIRILTEVGGIWRLAGLLWIIPLPLRDRLYMWIAHNRYAWFGTINSCPLPTPEERQYFRD